jgi:hypothetical protein
VAQARQLIPSGSGTHEADGNGTPVTLGGTDVDSLVARLLSLAVPLTFRRSWLPLKG